MKAELSGVNLARQAPWSRPAWDACGCVDIKFAGSLVVAGLCSVWSHHVRAAVCVSGSNGLADQITSLVLHCRPAVTAHRLLRCEGADLR